jgi:general secretion pathway protein F
MELATLVKDLSASLGAGQSLPSALRTLVSCAKGKKQRILSAVCEEVSQGVPFHVALKKYPRIFSIDFVTLIKAAETSGNIQKVLPSVAFRLDISRKTAREVQEALAYPALVLLFSIGGTLYLGGTVLPQLTEVLSRLGTPVPGLTGKMIAIMASLRSRQSLIVGVSIVTMTLAIYYFQAPRSRLTIRRLAFCLPIIGPNIRQYVEGVFFGTLSLFLQADVPFHLAIPMAIDVSGIVGRSSKQRVIEETMAGKAPSETLLNLTHFKPWQVDLIQRGEQTGTMKEAVERLSQRLDTEIVHNMKETAALVGPLFILIPGTLVGILAYSVIVSIHASMNIAGI